MEEKSDELQRGALMVYGPVFRGKLERGHENIGQEGKCEERMLRDEAQRPTVDASHLP